MSEPTVTATVEELSMTPSSTQHHLSIALPKSLAVRIHIHLTIHSHHILLFLTSRTLESAPGPAVLGSFVYALPSTLASAPVLSTPLYTREDTLEIATRIAKIVAKRTGRPTYVGCSVSFGAAGRGGSVEEEMEGVRNVVEIVVGKVREGKEIEKVGDEVENLAV